MQCVWLWVSKHDNETHIFPFKHSIKKQSRTNMAERRLVGSRKWRWVSDRQSVLITSLLALPINAVARKTYQSHIRHFGSRRRKRFQLSRMLRLLIALLGALRSLQERLDGRRKLRWSTVDIWWQSKNNVYLFCRTYSPQVSAWWITGSWTVPSRVLSKVVYGSPSWYDR